MRQPFRFAPGSQFSRFSFSSVSSPHSISTPQLPGQSPPACMALLFFISCIFPFFPPDFSCFFSSVLKQNPPRFEGREFVLPSSQQFYSLVSGGRFFSFFFPILVADEVAVIFFFLSNSFFRFLVPHDGN